MPASIKPLRDAFEKSLVPSIEFHQGDIFSVGDDPDNPIVKFPEDNLKKQSAEGGKKRKRTFHPQRYVLIIQDDKANNNLALPSVLVVPLSHTGRETEYSVLIPTEYLADHIPGQSIASINLTQPILKIFLRKKSGNVPKNSEVFTKIRATYLRIIGII